MSRGDYLARTAGGTKYGGGSGIQARKEAADTMKKEGITGVGDTNKEKREERTKRIEEALGPNVATIKESSPSQRQLEIIQANRSQPILKTKSKSNKFLTDTANLLNEYIGMGGLTGMAAKGIGAVFDSVFKPKASTFKGQNNLSIIKNLVKPEDLFDYYNTYRDVINEAGFDTTSDFIKAIESAPELGVQGTESQRRADPASYYDEDLFLEKGGEQDEMLKDYPEFLANMGLKPMSSRFANTTGNLVDKANIDVNTPGLSREFKQEIFNARMELDRMGKDRSGNPQGGIMTAPSAPPVPPPVIPPEMKEDPVPENPILNPVMSQRDPFDLAKFYASLPQYTQQGVMSPNLMEYYRNLGLFPRA